MSWQPSYQLKESLGKISQVLRGRLDLSGSFADMGACLAGSAGTVVLLSGTELDCARYNIMGAWPWLELKARQKQVKLRIDGCTFELEADPLEVVRWLLEACRLPRSDQFPLRAGLMGYMAYDLKDILEDLPRTGVDDLALPHLVLYSPRVLVVQDRRNGQVTTWGLQRTKGADPGQVLDKLRASLEDSVSRAGGPDRVGHNFVSTFEKTDYLAAVTRIREYIAAGDVYQVNLSQRLRIDFEADPYRLFTRLFAMNPAPFFAFVNAGDHQIISTSPERFLLRFGDRVETRPIKGTRSRSSDPVQDAANRRRLLESVKDGAELSMIVDLLRNDLGKVCRPGSVQVAEHKRIEAYSNVYHLVSVVQGELEQGKDTIDLVKAAFPGGSITGCPKVRAMEIIDELEPSRRHVYTGAIGYLGFDDTLDLSIAIRTATVVGGSLIFSVGGGIVYDSDPAAEYQETLDKGRTLIDVFGALRTDPEPGRVWFNGRITGTHKARVPVTALGLQYGFGFFETVRSLAGRQPLLDRHLVRFGRSWKKLFHLPDPDLDWPAVINQVLEANGLENQSAAVKIVAAYGTRKNPPFDYNLAVLAKPYSHRLKADDIPGLTLVTYPHPRQSPLAAHKSLNYLYYYRAGAWAGKNGGHEALVLNADGTVSETNTANLLVVYGKTVIRPVSQAALPGVMDAVVQRKLKELGYRLEQKKLRPSDLHAADALFLANALMGLVPVACLDGKPLGRGNELPWRRINTAIFGPGWQD